MVEPGTVLVIDDDPDIREMTRVALEVAGFQTIGAPDGSAALDLLRHQRPAPGVILLDLMMPVMDGCAVLSALRATDATRAIPVVIMSAFEPTHGTTRSADAVVRKPIDLDDLVATVARFVAPTPA